MAKGLVDEQNLIDIANAIRAKNGTSTQYKPSEMATAITNLPSGSTKISPDYISFYDYDGTSLDLSWLDTSEVTSMSNMFNGCNALTTLDLSSFDTSKVTNMASMFYGCSALTTLIINNPKLFELKATNCFDSSAIANGTGYVYVPDDMVDTYKAATNWSVYADQIKPISELPEEV